MFSYVFYSRLVCVCHTVIKGYLLTYLLTYVVLMVLIKQRSFFVILPILNRVKRLKPLNQTTFTHKHNMTLMVSRFLDHPEIVSFQYATGMCLLL